MDHLQRKTYPDDHWLRSHDPEKALAAYLDQQNKAYSRAKNAFILELLGDLKGKRFLDYGCGAGMFTVHAALEGASEVVGVDAEDYRAFDRGAFCEAGKGTSSLPFHPQRGVPVIFFSRPLRCRPHERRDRTRTGRPGPTWGRCGLCRSRRANNLEHPEFSVAQLPASGDVSPCLAQRQRMVRVGRNSFAFLYANESAQKIGSRGLSERCVEIGLFNPL